MSRKRMQWSSQRIRVDEIESAVLEHFERGTLVEVEPTHEYRNNDLKHIYYISEGARRKVGLRKVHQMESTDEFFGEPKRPDWEAIKELVSATELAEFAEARSVESTDGELSPNERGWTPFVERSEQSSDNSIPIGVVKFCDPAAKSVGFHNPEERGRCWASVRDRLSSQPDAKRLDYQNETEKTHPSDIRIPLWVSDEGTEAIAGYLVAHDCPDWAITTALDIDFETLQDFLKNLTKTNSAD